MDNARQLAEAGKRIQPIKMVRQLTGMSLEEAVAVVKEMDRQQCS
jgi:ribosomal protein L7/L12